MAKWFGKIGFAVTENTGNGIWEDRIDEKEYRGDVIRTNLRYQQSGSVNDDVTLNVSISIVSDPLAISHINNIRYVEYMGAKWKVTSIDPQPPRLILNLGGPYNE